jgi:DNA-binding GntR family transcriptional regulator
MNVHAPRHVMTPAPAIPPAEAYRHIRALIVRGQLAPGTRVSEPELAVRLGVSRTPAREAIRRLLADGLLVANGGGARPRVAVAPTGPADVEELYQAAGAIEGVVARRVATLSPKVRRGLYAELRSAEARFRSAARVRPPDYDLLFERHDAFHQALRRACAGPSVRALLETLQPRLDRYEWLYAPVIGPDFAATYKEHSAIIRAVRDGDGAVAERAVRANWFGGGMRLARALADAGDTAARVVVRHVAGAR